MITLLICLFVTGSRLLIENAIMSQLSDGRPSFILNNVGLTTVYHLEHLLTVTEVDLSGNMLHDLNGVCYLQSTRRLIVNNNKLTSCRDLERLAALESIDLRNNGKTSFSWNCLYSARLI